MKLEEAIAKAKILNDSLKELTDEYEGQGSFIAAGMAVSFKLVLDTILSALRPVSREQVEKVWKGEWEWYDEEVGAPLEGIERDWGWRCPKCKVVLPDDFDDPDNPPAMSFCQRCGAPMTDEAVQMVMERLEALKDGKGD